MRLTRIHALVGGIALAGAASLSYCRWTIRSAAAPRSGDSVESAGRAPAGERLRAAALERSAEIMSGQHTGVPAVEERPPRGDRERADGVRRRLAERRAEDARSIPSSVNLGTTAPAGSVPVPALTPEEEQRRRDYVQRAVREQYIPIAKSCYEELLTRDAKAAGKVVISLTIVGDGEVGVVEHVELIDGTTLRDPEFTLCMRESMYTSLFEAPPPGTHETTVIYPLDLSP